MSFIYVIGSEENKCCKIGFSENPEARLKQLQTGHPAKLKIFFVEPVADDKVRLVESAVHANIRHHRQYGEWFAIPADKAILQVQFAKIQLGID